MKSLHLELLAVAAVCGGAITLFIAILRCGRPPREDPRMARYRQQQLESARPPRR